jgi:hypothetical protein
LEHRRFPLLFPFFAPYHNHSFWPAPFLSHNITKQ